ncbi:MAG: glycosyltransferase [Patescibacteria group bacterium]
MKVAIAHDSITQLGGAERVLEALHELYPSAPVFTLVFDTRLKDHFEGWTIVSSPLQYLYNFIPKLQYLLPFVPLSLMFFNLNGFDLVISSSSGFIKNMKVPKGVKHVSYCHTPTRFLWLDQKEYLKKEVPGILRPFVGLYLKWLKSWDFKHAQNIDYIWANSENVKRRIQKYYNRESEVLYPWVDLDKFYPTTPKQDYYLVAGRLQAHKRVDLVIEAFNKNGKQLHVIGTGRDEERLKSIAHQNILFLGRVDDLVLCNEYSSAKAYIFPQEEDFGLMPLEANATGTPVIAYAKGGSLETIIQNKTGVFFDQQTPEAIIEAVKQFEEKTFSSEDLFEQAQRFSKEQFKARVLQLLAKEGLV